MRLVVRLHEGVKEARRYFGSNFDSAGVICGGNNCGTQAVLASYRTILRSFVGLAVSLPFPTRLSVDCNSVLSAAIHTGEESQSKSLPAELVASVRRRHARLGAMATQPSTSFIFGS